MLLSRRTIPLLLILLACTMPVQAQETVLLWPDGAPGAMGNEDADIPTLTIYRPDPAMATGASVVVCPGGGYAMLAKDHEGEQVAAWLTSRGVAAFVLTYRHGPRYNHPAPLQDAQRAIRYVRAHAQNLNLDPAQIGIWGFSAGGHLAATAGTHFDVGDEQAEDPLHRVSSRPDFLILSYPVITMTEPFVHEGSRRHLLGEEPDPVLMDLLSNEKQVTADTPPTFLFHTDADKPVPAENSIAFYLALREHGVPAELHIYEQGQHGVGLAPGDPILSTWTYRLADWMKGLGLLD